MAKRGNGEGSIYQTADGDWRGSITLGYEGGKRRRKYFYGKKRADVAEQIRAALNQVDDGVPFTTTGIGPTVEEWLKYWLEAIQRRRCRPRTWRGQSDVVRLHIVPTLGRVRLKKLTPEQVELLETKLEEKLSAARVLTVHRTLSRALTVAEQRGIIARNVCRLIDPPSVPKSEVKPLTKADARKLLAAADERRNSARWVLALALGMRQGEVLGLSWQDVDLDKGSLKVAQALERAEWQHGCEDREQCVSPKKPSRCPKRQGVPMRLVDPKSEAGKRALSLPRELVDQLRAHRVAQNKERLAAGNRWWDDVADVPSPAPEGKSWDLVFRTVYGRPIQYRADYSEWRELLETAGVRRARLHDARHTAATLLLVMRVAPRVVQEILGHSRYELTMSTYSHVVPELQRDAADKMGEALWGEEPATDELAQRRPRRSTRRTPR